MTTSSRGRAVVLDIPRCGWPDAGCRVLAKLAAVEIGATPPAGAPEPEPATYPVCGRHARVARSHHFEIGPLRES